jgi:hypothetical protein
MDEKIVIDKDVIIDINDFTEDENITYVPIIVKWMKDNELEQVKINVEDGMTLKFEQSEKTYTANAFDTSSGEISVWELEKEDVYNILGISHAFEDGYIKNGKYTYVLDAEDIIHTKNASTKQLVLWIGKDGQFVKANEIKNKDIAPNGGVEILHKGTNKAGKKGTYKILMLNP